MFECPPSLDRLATLLFAYASHVIPAGWVDHVRSDVNLDTRSQHVVMQVVQNRDLDRCLRFVGAHETLKLALPILPGNFSLDWRLLADSHTVRLRLIGRSLPLVFGVKRVSLLVKEVLHLRVERLIRGPLVHW